MPCGFPDSGGGKVPVGQDGHEAGQDLNVWYLGKKLVSGDFESIKEKLHRMWGCSCSDLPPKRVLPLPHCRAGRGLF